LARRSGHLTDEGARADGICDVVTCGIAPAVLLGSIAPSRPNAIERLAPRLYVAAIAWRVVKYGFPPRESHVFSGMPVTGAGATMAIGFQLRLPPRAMSYLTLAVVGTMLSRVPVLSGEAILRRGVRRQDLRRTN
jgi:phosphatidylserine synthase